MKYKLLVLIFVAFSLLSCNRKYDKNNKDSYIEVIGKSEKEVDPDVFYLGFSLTERQGVKSGSLTAMEQKVLEALQSLGVDVKADLSVTNMSGYNYYWWRRSRNVEQSKSYALFRSWADYNRQVTELEASTKEAELQQLKSQVNPHFLFNTINNVNFKVEKEPKVAYDMINKLDDLLHYQLKDTKREKVFLKNDISFFTDYLELEATRRNKLVYTIQADPDIYDLEVYPLLFIPFVENAVKHSLSAKGESIIDIVFTRKQEDLYFRCENTRPPVPVKHKAGGLGLKNIKRRLDLLYGNSYTLNITEKENKYTVELCLKI